MMLLAALLLAAPQPAAAPVLKPIDSATAIETFKLLCWMGLRDPAAFHAAVVQAPIPLMALPKKDPAQPSELYRADEAALTYVASDTLPPNIPPRQCILRVRLVGAADQLTLAARIGTALGLPSGRTRTSPAQSMTSWDVAGDDGRTTRIQAITRNASGGGTELRLSALLLAAR